MQASLTAPCDGQLTWMGEQGTTAEGNSGNIAYADVNAYTEHYLCVLNLSMMGRKRLSLKAIHSSHAAHTHLPC